MASTAVQRVPVAIVAKQVERALFNASHVFAELRENGFVVTDELERVAHILNGRMEGEPMYVWNHVWNNMWSHVGVDAMLLGQDHISKVLCKVGLQKMVESSNMPLSEIMEVAESAVRIKTLTRPFKKTPEQVKRTAERLKTIIKEHKDEIKTTH